MGPSDTTRGTTRLRAPNSVISQMDVPTQEAVRVWMASANLAARVQMMLGNDITTAVNDIYH